MPEHYHKGDRVARLFAMRLARRRGEMDADDPELASFGESLGVMGGGPAQVQQAGPVPQEVATMGPTAAPKPPQRDTGIPALDAMANVPRQPSRGLVHDRRLGRVTKMGM